MARHVVANFTSHNKRLALRALFAPSGFRKTVVGLRPLYGFPPPHFASPGLAPQALFRAGKTSPTLNVKRKFFITDKNKLNNVKTIQLDLPKIKKYNSEKIIKF